MSLDLLRNELAQNKRFSEILGAYYDAVGVGRRTGRQQQYQHRENCSTKIRSAGRHRGCSRLSSHPTPKSATSARMAAGMAPARITRLSTIAKPRKMNSPRPPAPIAAAIVASPTEITTATRTPDRITLTASGNST